MGNLLFQGVAMYVKSTVPLGFYAWATTKFDKTRKFLAPKSLALAENWLNCQEKTYFLLILIKPVEPALEGTLVKSHIKLGMLTSMLSQQLLKQQF